MKYRKKPVIVEAFEFVEAAPLMPLSSWPTWLSQAFLKDKGVEGALWESSRGNWYVGTLEGALSVSFGDFIIQGVKGEIYPCRADIFHETYEAVEG